MSADSICDISFFSSALLSIPQGVLKAKPEYPIIWICLTRRGETLIAMKRTPAMDQTDQMPEIS